MLHKLKMVFIHAGRITAYFIKMISDLKILYKYPGLFFNALFFIGPASLPIIGGTAIVIGAVMVFHMYIQLGYFIPPDMIGKTVSYSFLIEGAPLLVGIGLAGRVGSTYAAEVGTMQVTEQIDVLKMTGINPVVFLFTPKFWASLIMGPLLFFYSFIMAVAGGFMMSKLYMHLPAGIYWKSAISTVDNNFVFGGILKSIVFAVATVFIAVYTGMQAQKGSSSVGEMTTKAVVFGVAAVAILDYIVNVVVFG